MSRPKTNAQRKAMQRKRPRQVAPRNFRQEPCTLELNFPTLGARNQFIAENLAILRRWGFDVG